MIGSMPRDKYHGLKFTYYNFVGALKRQNCPYVLGVHCLGVGGNKKFGLGASVL